MNKKNWILVGVIALVAAMMLMASPMLLTQTDEDAVIITVGGIEYARVPLTKPQTVTVRQATGEVNVVEITDRGAVMVSSTCKNQQCVHMGAVTLDNWEFRPNQTFIVCLPNRVTVELAVKE